MTDQALPEVVDSFDWANLPVGFIGDPYPVYAALREYAPVKRLPDGSVMLSRHADLMRVYRDADTFSSDKREEFGEKYGAGLTCEHHTTSLVFNDPPAHTQVRRILQGALTPRAVSYMEAPVTALVDRLLDRLEEAGGGDLIADFAAAIPVEVIGNLLGVPDGARGPLRDWSLAILGALEPQIDVGVQARSDAAVRDFLGFLDELIAARRAALRDPETDMLSRLILGGTEGETLSGKALMHNCIFLLNAGHETTTNLIGNGLVLLHDHPEARRRLVDEPGLIVSAVNEVLRFESSNQLGNRKTTRPVEIGGEMLAAGTRLTLCIGAANRDPDAFEVPDVFDISRQRNRHLAFAAGPHACLGLGVAQLEGRLALGRFVQRFAGFELTGAPVRSQRVRFRGFEWVPARVR